MCNSTEVYMTDTYVCTDRGFTAMFAKSNEGLAVLRKADHWKKVN